MAQWVLGHHNFFDNIFSILGLAGYTEHRAILNIQMYAY